VKKPPYSSIILITVVLSLSLLSGCSSVRSRIDTPESRWTVYPGIQRDGNDLITTVEGKLNPAWTGVLVGPVLVLDIPFSLVLDTLALPYDLYVISEPAEKFPSNAKNQETP
jgi:uncharacterized protein YceK